jgi:hypothetical protein
MSERGVSWDEDDSHDAVPWLELAQGKTRLDVAERLAQAHLADARAREARDRRSSRRGGTGPGRSQSATPR